MCGIVGYTGHRQALGRRARGAEPPGVPRLRLGRGGVLADGELAWVKRAGKLGNLKSALAQGPPLPGTVGLGHTRWATHGAAHRPERAPAHRLRRPSGRRAQRHHRELRRAARRARGGRPRADLGDRHRARRAPAGGADVLGAGRGGKWRGGKRSGGKRSGGLHGAERGKRHGAAGALADAMRAVCQRLEGAFTLVAVDIRDPEVGRGRAPQLAAGGRPGRWRELPGQRRRRVHRVHQGRGGARPGPGRRAARRTG